MSISNFHATARGLEIDVENNVHDSLTSFCCPLLHENSKPINMYDKIYTVKTMYKVHPNQTKQTPEHAALETSKNK